MTDIFAHVTVLEVPTGLLLFLAGFAIGALVVKALGRFTTD